jgi:polysaccharide deacetylase 2 family uncharacterized protein YibQ
MALKKDKNFNKKNYKKSNIKSIKKNKLKFNIKNNKNKIKNNSKLKKLTFYRNLLYILTLIFCLILCFTIIVSIKYKENITKIYDELNKSFNEKINNSNLNVDKKNKPNNIKKDKISKDIISNDQKDKKLDYKSFEKKVDLEKKIKICIILDDAGYSLEQLNILKDLKIKINISILPFLKYSKETLNIINNSKNLFPLIHIPMEPKNSTLINNYNNYENSKEYFLLLEDDYFNLENKIKRILIELPLKYANNHMGSKISESSLKTEEILEILKKYNIKFIDSNTTNNSYFKISSIKLNYNIKINNYFLDNENDFNKINNIFSNAILTYKALQNGELKDPNKIDKIKNINNNIIILIGHITKNETINFLKYLNNISSTNEIEFLFVSEIF